ncbi:cytochrome P450 714C2-like [Cannabis sativa]|uniref:cytochrome P450 714C2-like n=1 Tax=Cannabis sativa TaxID=3483 RepID=UPI0029C9B9D1|nr:cytochrome P450 714C2-like [Cannabis sativa]
MILKVVKQKTDAADEKNLLKMILEGAKAFGGVDSPSLGLTQDKFIVDNCKRIYFADHESTGTTTSWALLLGKLEFLTMVIQETLRLYPSIVYVLRNALQDVQYKDILVPKGVNIQIPISIMQQDTNLWGPDAHQFNPGRFEHGVLGASKFPQSYMPFGVGTRICIGQHLAMTELKVVVALLLSKFCFLVSPAYRYAAAFRLVIESEHGVNV